MARPLQRTLSISPFCAYFHTIAVRIECNRLVVAVTCTTRALKHCNAIIGKPPGQFVNPMICADLNCEVCQPERLCTRCTGRQRQRGRLHNLQTSAIAKQKETGLETLCWIDVAGARYCVKVGAVEALNAIDIICPDCNVTDTHD